MKLYVLSLGLIASIPAVAGNPSAAFETVDAGRTQFKKPISWAQLEVEQGVAISPGDFKYKEKIAVAITDTMPFKGTMTDLTAHVRQKIAGIGKSTSTKSTLPFKLTPAKGYELAVLQCEKLHEAAPSINHIVVIRKGGHFAMAMISSESKDLMKKHASGIQFVIGSVTFK